MALPIITMEFINIIYGLPTTGDLIYKYSPFQNLQVRDLTIHDTGLDDLRLLSKEAEISTVNPLNLSIEKTYDESVNLIISDNINPLKIVNSRFYLTSSDKYAIADRKGNLDTNIYTKENFSVEAGLIKTVRSIITLDFEGVEDGGILPVGNYNFYFKLADFDGNESDFIAESGQVVCYIGAVNNPKSIRGGQQNENSSKLINFQLNNLDLAYDYINVYYTRSTGNSDVSEVIPKKLNNKFKITGTSTKLVITGYEETSDIDISDINLRYSYFNSAKTTTNCQNMLFVGNITNDYDIFNMLEKYSLFITPSLSFAENIGNINSNYIDSWKSANEYYNPNNIYYKLSYWDNEMYRLGIVYIMNDYTLSPVFNIRGKKEISEVTSFSTLDINKEIKFNSDYIIEGTDENVKGVFKINASTADGASKIFNGADGIRPIGIKLNFADTITTDGTTAYPNINTLTKGFFIVRQKRIPTILAQGVSISTTKKGYIPTIKASTSKGLLNLSESFLTSKSGNPILGRDIYGTPDNDTNINALLCPEANIRSAIYGSLFNSSEFKLISDKYVPTIKEKFIKLDSKDKLFGLGNLEADTESSKEVSTELLLVQPNTVLISNKDKFFSSVAGNEWEAWKHTDPINGNIEDLAESTATEVQLSSSIKKTRGIFNSYIGSSKNLTKTGTYYNIYNKDYNFSDWKKYFTIRNKDASSFSPISDRVSWGNDIANDYSLSCYRGDCYINTYTHRMMWNFVDPELPTNNRIVDKYTWLKNYRVDSLTVKSTSTGFSVEDTAKQYTNPGGKELTYKKVIPLFTYKIGDLEDDIDKGTNLSGAKILTPEAKKFSKYVDSNGSFGFNEINRPDVNAVNLGHWATFKIRSNINLALRDEDFSNPKEEAIHHKKRSFYPYSSSDQNNKLAESDVINVGISKSLGSRLYFELPEVPFIKTNFTNRIHASNLAIESAFKDGSRIFNSTNYQDYTMDHGQLIKLVEWQGTLIAVMEHGVLQIPVNERAMMQNASGENVYINTEKILPQNPKALSSTFGSFWAESIIKTERYIYGIDTVAKKIWRTNGGLVETFSDLKIQKFLNDNINIKVTDRKEDIDYNLIKTHYNAFKHDIIFTYKYGLEKWSICWNELTEKWSTRYTWFPEFSENINNIFFTFANKSEHPEAEGKLFKHGFAGAFDEKIAMRPTVWYEEQHPFEFEFVVTEAQGIQKIFDNLKIISNKTEPLSFTYEVVGEGYNWYDDKEVITWMEGHTQWNSGTSTEGLDFAITEGGYYEIQDVNDNANYVDGYTYLLTHTIEEIEIEYPDFPTPYGMSGTDMFTKLAYIPKIKTSSVLDRIDWGSVEYGTALVNDLWNGEDRVLKYQEGKNIHKVGRIQGNMDHVEDSWEVQIQPITIRWAFVQNGTLLFTSIKQMKIRDKYIKIRVKYDGVKLAIINAIRTLFTISYN